MSVLLSFVHSFAYSAIVIHNFYGINNLKSLDFSPTNSKYFDYNDYNDMELSVTPQDLRFINNLESPTSIVMGISREENARILPAPPGKVNIRVLGNEVRLTWFGTGLDIIQSYVIYKKCGDQDWIKIRVINVYGDNRGIYEFADSYESNCHYTVAAVDIYGNEGPKSVEIDN